MCHQNSMPSSAARTLDCSRPLEIFDVEKLKNVHIDKVPTWFTSILLRPRYLIYILFYKSSVFSGYMNLSLRAAVRIASAAASAAMMSAGAAMARILHLDSKAQASFVVGKGGGTHG